VLKDGFGKSLLEWFFLVWCQAGRLTAVGNKMGNVGNLRRVPFVGEVVIFSKNKQKDLSASGKTAPENTNSRSLFITC
jgi:hypothetical protein